MKLTCKGITKRQQRCKKNVRAPFCHQHCDQDVENVTCAICFDMLWKRKNDKFVNEKAIFELPKCRHAFHVECALKWITENRSCPVCRKKVKMSTCVRIWKENNRQDLSEHMKNHFFLYFCIAVCVFNQYL